MSLIFIFNISTCLQHLTCSSCDYFAIFLFIWGGWIFSRSWPVYSIRVFTFWWSFRKSKTRPSQHEDSTKVDLFLNFVCNLQREGFPKRRSNIGSNMPNFSSQLCQWIVIAIWNIIHNSSFNMIIVFEVSLKSI